MQLAMITAQQVAVLFLLIFTGAAATKAGILRSEGKQTLSGLLVNVVVPAMILNSYQMEFSMEILRNLLAAFGLSVLAILLGTGVTVLLTARRKDSRASIFRFACIFSNAAYMGFPLISALFGAEGLLYASAYVTVFNLLLWTLGYGLVSGKASARELGRSLLHTPVLYAMVIGLTIYLLQLPLPSLIVQPLQLLGGMNTPLSMLITGMLIGSGNLRTILADRQIWQLAGVRMLLIPAVCMALFALLGLLHFGTRLPGGRPAGMLPCGGHHLCICGAVRPRRGLCRGQRGADNPAQHPDFALMRPGAHQPVNKNCPCARTCAQGQFCILLKIQQVQPDLWVIHPLYPPRQGADHQLGSGADPGIAQVAAHHRTGAVCCAHVQVTVELSVHRVDGPRQRYDLIAARVLPRTELLCLGVKHADGKLVHRADALDAGQVNLFHHSQLSHLFQDLLPFIQPDNDRIIKAFVLHTAISFVIIAAQGLLLFWAALCAIIKLKIPTACTGGLAAMLYLDEFRLPDADDEWRYFRA